MSFVFLSNKRIFEEITLKMNNSAWLLFLLCKKGRKYIKPNIKNQNKTKGKKRQNNNKKTKLSYIYVPVRLKMHENYSLVQTGKVNICVNLKYQIRKKRQKSQLSNSATRSQIQTLRTGGVTAEVPHKVSARTRDI